MNDNDVNVSGLVTKLGLNRRQFLAATTGMAAAAAVTAPSALAATGSNGVLIPSGKRGIILYTVRDAISRDPQHLRARLRLQGGPRGAGAGSATSRSSSPATTRTPTPTGGNVNNPAGAALLRTWLDDNGLEAEGNHGNIPGVDHRRHDRRVRRRLRDRQHPRDGPHRHRQRPDRQRLRRRLGARGRALELLRCSGRPPTA